MTVSSSSTWKSTWDRQLDWQVFKWNIGKEWSADRPDRVKFPSSFGDISPPSAKFVLVLRHFLADTITCRILLLLFWIFDDISSVLQVLLCIWPRFDSRPKVGKSAGRWQYWVIILNYSRIMLTVKRLATCRTRVGSHGIYITFTSGMWIRPLDIDLQYISRRGIVAKPISSVFIGKYFITIHPFLSYDITVLLKARLYSNISISILQNDQLLCSILISFNSIKGFFKYTEHILQHLLQTAD